MNKISVLQLCRVDRRCLSLPLGGCVLLEEISHSFILKIWFEESDAPLGTLTWRGHVTHIPSHQKVYVKGYQEIEQFIRPFLDQNQNPEPANE